MKWNDCFRFACWEKSDAIIRANADALVRSGMKAAGNEYVNVDGCWQGHRADVPWPSRLKSSGQIPDMREHGQDARGTRPAPSGDTRPTIWIGLASSGRVAATPAIGAGSPAK